MDSRKSKINVPYVFGKVTQFGATYNMAHPEMELLEEHKASLRSGNATGLSKYGKIINKGISNKVINKMMQQLFGETKLCSQKFTELSFDELKLIPKMRLCSYSFSEKSRFIGKSAIQIKV